MPMSIQQKKCHHPSRTREDIVIPESLIAATRGSTQDWVPYRRDHELVEQGPVQHAVHQAALYQRRMSLNSQHDRRAKTIYNGRLRTISLASPLDIRAARENDFNGRPCKTSNPATAEERTRSKSVALALSVDRNSDQTFHTGAMSSTSFTLSQFRFPPPIQAPNRPDSMISTSSSAMPNLSAEGGCFHCIDPQLIHENPRSSITFDHDDTSQDGSCEQYRDVEAQRPNRISIFQNRRKSIVSSLQNRRKSIVSSLQNRRKSIVEAYERAKVRGLELERKPWVRFLFECSVYLLLLSFIYFVLVGLPLWKGAVYGLYWLFSSKLNVVWGWSITIGIALFSAFAPLLVFFENEPPTYPNQASDGSLVDRNEHPGVRTTALLIPCYKSAEIIGPTLEAALRIFPPSHIFVIANGNSPTPLDNTEEICRLYGVIHIWSPVGSKIVAQFVGCHAAKAFENVLLIDDDCALPPNFPVVSNRLDNRIQCVGYTIKSVGANGGRGTLCQQAQDLEYKISGLQRTLAGKLGSATFPHGAISIWNRDFLIRTFNDHPGFSVSEDWFFGHSCRRLGGRIKMCTEVFVETETPGSVFFSGRGASRGGFGEMTVFKQRFLRWNFFFVNGIWYNMSYVLCSWKLGWWELGAKIFVLQEVYETLLYLMAPFVLPISFIVHPGFCGCLFAATILLYYINIIIFNLVHLRRRNESVSWTVCLFYYPVYKLALCVVNVASCYWSLYKYGRYFARRHPKVVEDEKAVGVVLRLEEMPPVVTRTNSFKNPDDDGQMGRRMTVTAIPIWQATTATHGQQSEEDLSPSMSTLAPSTAGSDGICCSLAGSDSDGLPSTDINDFAAHAPAIVQLPDRAFLRGAEM